MTQIEDQAGTPAIAGQAEELQVRIARQLLGQAKAEGVSLAGPGGLQHRLGDPGSRLYARGLATGDIRGHLEEIYGWRCPGI